jgi:hypothetical protein
MQFSTTAPATRSISRATTRPTTRTPNAGRALWVAQGVLAAVFLFAGASKLVMPAADLADQSDFPVLFLRFIGACEVLGAVGLILPAVLRIRPGLTPLAAAGLVVIMIGATVTTIATGFGVAAALLPFGVGVIAATVAWGRVTVAPRTSRS